MTHYSVFSLLKNALSNNKNWDEAWRKPDPKPAYDAIIVGGGGHGLATAYYLAKEFKITNVAVLEKGLIGQGNVGRNTTIVRSNYLLAGNARFYEFSLKLWEGLSKDLNYNVMFSQRGVLSLLHTPDQLDSARRHGNAMRLNGIDSDILSIREIKRKCPGLDLSPHARFPIVGGLYQGRGGTARHDAIAWGFARGASNLGVDIIENCEVTGFNKNEKGTVVGVETTRGTILAPKVGVAVAGNTSRVMSQAGFDTLPIESHCLQAFVTESYKPVLDTVVVFGGGHFYISQSDKGGLVFGGSIEGYNSYAARGNLPVVRDVTSIGVSLFPHMSRLKLLRMWGGIMDMSMDGSPIIDKTPIDGLYLNAGWCYGGFKATPGSGYCFAHLLAKDEPHQTSTELRFDRFRTGAVLDEHGCGLVANMH